MFNTKKKKPGVNSMKTSDSGTKKGHNLSSVNMVSDGTEILGTLKTTSDIRVAGKVDGEAKVQGKIIIASSGYVDGNIEAEDADIAGRVEGEVHISSKLTLRQSAVVEGDLYSQNLVVEEGATFNGACHMRDYATENKRAEEAAETEKEEEKLAV